MDYKIIAIDADGTLLDSNHQISNENKSALMEAQQLGIHMVMCSGRSPHTLVKMMDEIKIENAQNYIIGFNGGIVLDAQTMETLSETRLAKRHVIDIAAQLGHFNVGIMAYEQQDKLVVEKWTSYSKEYSELAQLPLNIYSFEKLPPSVNKLLLGGETKELIRAKNYYTDKVPEGVNMFFTGVHLLEFTGTGATKGAALKFLCQKLNIPAGASVAIGDSYNDISMIQAAGLGVVMANANDDVKALGKYVTKNDNNNSGVAEAVRKLVIKEMRA